MLLNVVMSRILQAMQEAAAEPISDIESLYGMTEKSPAEEFSTDAAATALSQLAYQLRHNPEVKTLPAEGPALFTAIAMELITMAKEHCRHHQSMPVSEGYHYVYMFFASAYIVSRRLHQLAAKARDLIEAADELAGQKLPNATTALTGEALRRHLARLTPADCGHAILHKTGPLPF